MLVSTYIQYGDTLCNGCIDSCITSSCQRQLRIQVLTYFGRKNPATMLTSATDLYKAGDLLEAGIFELPNK